MLQVVLRKAPSGTHDFAYPLQCRTNPRKPVTGSMRLITSQESSLK